jgi:ketosteroid isomerase-like protein
VIGRWIGRGENHGQRFDYTARFSSVYVRREKGWQIVLDHSTPLA